MVKSGKNEFCESRLMGLREQGMRSGSLMLLPIERQKVEGISVFNLFGSKIYLFEERLSLYSDWFKRLFTVNRSTG